MDSPGIMIKVIVLVHFVLSAWGSMGNYLPSTYLYVNAGVAVCGVWAIAVPQSADAVVMTLAALVFSALEDILLLALYEPRGYNAYERGTVSADVLHEYRFALGMAITNLILKPFTGFLLYRVLRARNNDADFSIPGVDRLPGLGGGRRGEYSDIDNSPDSAPYTPAARQPSPSPPPPQHHSQDKE